MSMDEQALIAKPVIRIIEIREERANGTAVITQYWQGQNSAIGVHVDVPNHKKVRQDFRFEVKEGFLVQGDVNV